MNYREIHSKRRISDSTIRDQQAEFGLPLIKNVFIRSVKCIFILFYVGRYPIDFVRMPLYVIVSSLTKLIRTDGRSDTHKHAYVLSAGFFDPQIKTARFTLLSQRITIRRAIRGDLLSREVRLHKYAQRSSSSGYMLRLRVEAIVIYA